jgi:hypothetical protein
MHSIVVSAVYTKLAQRPVKVRYTGNDALLFVLRVTKPEGFPSSHSPLMGCDVGPLALWVSLLIVGVVFCWDADSASVVGLNPSQIRPAFSRDHTAQAAISNGRKIPEMENPNTRLKRQYPTAAKSRKRKIPIHGSSGNIRRPQNPGNGKSQYTAQAAISDGRKMLFLGNHRTNSACVLSSLPAELLCAIMTRVDNS